MAFVPGFENDIFISYARGDSAEWIRAFEESLRDQLRDVLGTDVGIWQDTLRLRLGDNWPGALADSIRASAAFLAIISPSYMNAPWCAKERKIFLDHCRSRGELQIGHSSRFLKIVKSWPDDKSPLLPDIQDYRFFTRIRGTTEVRTAIPGTDDFRARIEDAGCAIAALLQLLRRRREAVFVASAYADCERDWTELREELHAHGYDVRPTGIIDPDFDRDWIRKQCLDSVKLSVHMLGEVYDPFIEEQIDLALEMERRLVFWFCRTAEGTKDKKQIALLDSIVSGAKQKKSPWALLRGSSRRTMIDDLKGMLQTRREMVRTEIPSGSPQVYLLCDSTTPEDAYFADHLKMEIQRSENMAVSLETDPPDRDRKDNHQRLLRESQGLLLFRQRAPERWLRETLPEAMVAEKLMQRPPFRSKALLSEGAAILQDSPELRVIPCTPGFSIKDLEPFLAPLRTSGAPAHVGN